MGSDSVGIYHRGCPDGMMSAVAFMLANPGAKVIAMSHGMTPPEDEVLAGKHVYIMDFSFDLATTQRLAAVARSVVILDHHKTAIRELGKLHYAVLDANRSGAQITWDYFFPGSKRPTLLDAVGDRDTWQFKLKHTRELCAMSEALPKDLDAWAEAMFAVEADPEQYVHDGGVIADWKECLIERVAEGSFTAELDGIKVPAICSQIWKSELGHVLCRGQPFAIVYSGSHRNWAWSLRSDRDGMDVEEIAAAHGGGGHRHAASFRSDTAPTKIQ